MTTKEKKLLKKIQSGKVTYWDQDDSNYDMVKAATQAAYEGGGRVLRLGYRGVVQLRHDEPPSSGRLVFLPE